MGFSLGRIFGILVCISFWSAWVLASPAPANSSSVPPHIQSFLNSLSELRQNYQSQELLESVRLTPSDLQRQEQELVRQITTALRNDPRIFGYQGGQSLSEWLVLPVASHPENRWIFETFIGRLMMSTPDRAVLFRQLADWGLLPQLQFWFQEARRIEPETVRGLSFERWLLRVGTRWFQEQQKRLQDSGGRGSTFNRLLNLVGVGLRYEGLYHSILKRLPLDVRFDLVERSMQFESRSPSNFLVPLFFRDISLRTWVREQPELFRQVIETVGRNSVSASGFFRAYGTEEFLQSRWNIFSVQQAEEGRLHLVTARGEGLTVAQQLLLSSDGFRSVIWGQLVPVLDRDWVRSLIGFGFVEGVPQNASLGAALAANHMMADPRWAVWMLQLDQNIRREALEALTRQSQLYQINSEEMLRLHRLILSDLVSMREVGEAPGPHERLALERYLQEGMQEESVRQRVLVPALPEIFSQYRPEVWNPILREVVIPMHRGPRLNALLLDTLHSHRINDLRTLRLLNRAFGVPESFVRDLGQVRRDTALEAEFRSMAFDQAYFRYAERGGLHYRCTDVFSF